MQVSCVCVGWAPSHISMYRGSIAGSILDCGGGVVNFKRYQIQFEEGLRLPAASSVKRIRVDTPIPIALHITSEPVPLFLQRFGTWPSSGNSNELKTHCYYLMMAKCRNVVKITELVRM